MLRYEELVRVKVYVICCNDSLEFAVIGSEEKALAVLSELKSAYFDCNRWMFHNDLETYKRNCYWHIHTVEGVEG